MQDLPPMITNGMQLATIYGCPALAIAVSWIGGERGRQRLTKAGGLGGAAGGSLLFVFEQLTLPVPWWGSASHFIGVVIVGVVMGAAIDVVAARFRRS